LTEYGNLLGVTANDLADADAGVNNLQNHPVLTHVRFNPAVSFINGKGNCKPGATSGFSEVCELDLTDLGDHEI
jgi:hypothetical protein